MEGDLQQRALIPSGGARSDMDQPLCFVSQPQQVRVQANQVTFAVPSLNRMQEIENGLKALLATKDDDPRGKATASASQQQRRLKWNGDMAKLLVSAVSYIDEDLDADHGSSRVKKTKGKWKLVSSAMTERGFAASPQQCEDKFHDLNKRYKRLTEILGYGTACGVVKKPALLEQMNLPENLKDEARKLLSSKNLHYEEMCSYHNRNRQCLLVDPSLQKMIWNMAHGSLVEQGVECRTGYGEEGDDEEARGDGFKDDLEGSAEDHRHRRVHGTKKPKHGHEEGSRLPQDAAIDMKAIQIKGERLKIIRETLEMRQSHMKRMRSIKEKDKELKKMKLDNEMMELENDKLELELEVKIKEMEMMGIKPKRI